MVAKEKERQYGKDGKKKPLCVSPPIFSILVWSKVFARVLMGRDDLDIIVMEGWLYEGGSVYLTEIQSKPKMSLVGENARRAGIRRCPQDPDSCVCDPAALDSQDKTKVSAIEADIKRTQRVRWLDEDVQSAIIG